MITSLYRTADGLLKHNLDDDELRQAVRGGKGLLWVDFHKPSADEVFKLDEVFGLHPLAIEDCQHVSQYPKLDEFGNYLFLVFMAPNPRYKPGEEAPEGEEPEDPVHELDLFLGPNYVITFHLTQLPFMNALMERAKRDSKRVMGREAAFLVHDILDAAVDQFFAMVDKMQDEVEEAEDELEQHGQQEVLSQILSLKRRVLHLRRQMSDHRELIQRMLRGNHGVVVPQSHIYFRNILDHVNRIEDDLDVCRDTIDNARDVYLALANVRTNEVMKVLTIMFVLSMPFTVLTSWFGMNFDYLPGAKHESGHWIYTAIMVLSALLMFFWLRAKKFF